jgi:hypothetical protein
MLNPQFLALRSKEMRNPRLMWQIRFHNNKLIIYILPQHQSRPNNLLRSRAARIKLHLIRSHVHHPIKERIGRKSHNRIRRVQNINKKTRPESPIGSHPRRARAKEIRPTAIIVTKIHHIKKREIKASHALQN